MRVTSVPWNQLRDGTESQLVIEIRNALGQEP